MINNNTITDKYKQPALILWINVDQHALIVTIAEFS